MRSEGSRLCSRARFAAASCSVARSFSKSNAQMLGVDDVAPRVVLACVVELVIVVVVIVSAVVGVVVSVVSVVVSTG